jgi:methylmalonyl-CoA/ethylmalonyl-CoA epimerase
MTITSTAPLRLEGIGQIAVNVQDLERATTFYRNILGLTFLFAVPGMAFFDCGGVRLLLGRTERPELDHPASILYYRVEDIAAVHRTLAARGVAFEDPPHPVHRAETYVLWLAFFRDSEANLAALMSEVPRE